MVAQDTVDLLAAQVVGMFGEDAGERGVPDRLRALLGQRRHVLGDILPVARDEHLAVGLDADGGHQLYIPAGFAHGFCTIEPESEVLYKVDAPYDAAADRGLAWDDPELDLPWPVDRGRAILSDKDRRQPRLRDLGDPFPA